MITPMIHHDTALAPPGAGIPTLETWIGRSVLWWMRHCQTPAQGFARFDHEASAILQLVTDLPEVPGGRQILIPRPRGIEDSSRNWSAWMTLQHLAIVNAGITGIIRDLLAGRTPGGVVRIEDVKPTPDIGREILGEYQDSCRILSQTARRHLRDARAPAGRHPHPWFGPLDAASWFCLAAGHLGLHRVQIRRILARLGTQNQPR